MPSPRLALLAVALLSLIVARRRPSLRPVAVALCVLLTLDSAAYLCRPWWRVHLAIYTAWPGVLAWLVWVTHTGRRGVVLACGWALASAAVAACVPAWGYGAALVGARLVLAGAVVPVAWAMRKDEGLGTEAPSPSSEPPSTTSAGPVQHAHRRAVAQARGCAMLLAAGNAAGLVLGAWQHSPPAWHLARAATWATYGAVAVVLLGALRRKA